MSSRAPQIRDVTLDNGLRVLLVSDTAMPVVDVRLLVDVGTADAHDSPGLAYAAAHKLRPRVGRDTDPGDLAVLREVGRRARAFLPDVGPRTTAFRLRGLATHVDLLVRALALFVPQGDYAGAPADPPPPPIPPARTAYERYRRAFRAAVFGADHPAARPPGGAPVRATIAALRAFAARHYRPDNAVLIVVGRFDADLALAHARRWFGSWSRGDRVAPRPTSTPSTRAPGPVYLGFDTDDDSIELRIGFPVASGVDARFPVRQVLARLLARRLAAVRDQLGASYGLTARRLPDVGADLLAIEGRLDGARAGQALALILAALDALRAGGDTFAADVARARRSAVRELAASAGDSASIATRLAFVAEHGLPLDFHDRLVARVAAVTADDVLALIGAELAADRVTVGLSGSRTLIDRAYATAGVRGVRHVD